jgi:hypothetical protein
VDEAKAQVVALEGEAPGEQERTPHRSMLQEPPRIARRVQLAAVHAAPSDGALA